MESSRGPLQVALSPNSPRSHHPKPGAWGRGPCQLCSVSAKSLGTTQDLKVSNAPAAQSADRRTQGARRKGAGPKRGSLPVAGRLLFWVATFGEPRRGCWVASVPPRVPRSLPRGSSRGPYIPAWRAGARAGGQAGRFPTRHQLLTLAMGRGARWGTGKGFRQSRAQGHSWPEGDGAGN